MAEEIVEGKVFATFERFNEFLDLQKSLLALDLQEEPGPEVESKELLTQQTLNVMLTEYQEQSYLLDPYLEQLVEPVVECLKSHAKQSIAHPECRASPIRVKLIAFHMYNYIKCRGYKTIIRFFPHEIADLSIALDYMQLPNGLVHEFSQWALRYVILLWLYLICMIPFDLVQFDEAENIGATAAAIESIAMTYLGRAGLEREAAVLLLSRLYTRKDAGEGFHKFIQWSHTLLREGHDVFTTIGLLGVLCEVVKSGSAEQVQAELVDLMTVTRIVKQTSVFTNNTVVRKLNTKLISRIGLRLLPAGLNTKRRKARDLVAGEITNDLEDMRDDVDVPDDVEHILEELFEALQDRDTIVRWSAAKGVARLAERLPKDFASQVLETILGLFAIHSLAAASMYDLPAIAESTWHGACLACAEIARRNLIEPEYLHQLIEWLSKALYFDLRKGAHSIGSNVRDAASYGLWALARSQNHSALIPHANNLAQRLATVALYDREIHIRRAASAAFQEHVGRTNLFPHGIDVLGKTDFYAVSLRRNAFLIAAPQVANHVEYQRFLFDHILNVLLRHWDVSMRELGSQSLRFICLHDMSVLAPLAIEKSVHLLESFDMTDTHGGLLSLCEIANAYRESEKDPSILESHLRNIFKHLSRIPESNLTTTRNDLVVAASCQLIADSMTVTEIELGEGSSVRLWRKILDVGLKHRSTFVQEAAADAMRKISDLTDSSADVFRLIKEMKRGSPIMQQSLARVLSVINYSKHPSTLPQAIAYLLDGIKSKSTVETRRSCFLAIPRILALISPHLATYVSNEVVNTLVDALLEGLDDYTIDERGDVGSWVRMVCIQGLTSISELLFRDARSIPDFDRYFPPQKYHAAIAGILKQGVERLDNVRQQAGACFMKILTLSVPSVSGGDRWRLPGLTLLHKLFLSETEQIGWNEGAWLFPRALHLLEIPEYRKDVLRGIVISIGSRTDSTQRPVADNLVKFAQGLPLVRDQTSTYSLSELVVDLINHAKSNMTANAVVVPVFRTFNVLLEADVLRQLPNEVSGLRSLTSLLHMSSKNIDRLKSVQRIQEAMKIVVNLVILDQFRKEKASTLSSFLAHPFPTIRTDTAEYLYVFLQSKDIGFETDEIEEILLDTEWSASDMGVVQEAANNIVQLFDSLGN